MSEEFLFAEEPELEEAEHLGTWKLLVVDDEPEVHAVTKLALSDFVFQDKHLMFLSAHSGAEAKLVLEEHDDIAVVLLDVVMETDNAGLEVADHIRNHLNNHFTRIILRTGQPGQAPEKDIILNYDINDYKSKTELTAQKLFTAVIASLRSYRDIMVIEENRLGLEKIIQSSADLFSVRSMEGFIEGLMQQLSSLLGCTKEAAYITSAVAGPKPIDLENPSEFFVFTGQGDYENLEGKSLCDVVEGEKLQACFRALEEQTLICEDEYVVAYCQGQSVHGSLLYLSGLPRKLTQTDKNLISIFAQNVQIAFDNVLLNRDINDTQKEIVARVEQALDKNVSAYQHIYRMVEMCELLGREYGLPSDQVEMLKLAVPLHDIGKLRVPSETLKKAGPLTEQEKLIVREHVESGYNMLSGSRRPIIKTAAQVAKGHHEHWDGNGYPRGICGEQIHIFCRITAVADVYDALRNKLAYKEAWPLEKVLELFRTERGKQFEPRLVDILLAKTDEFEDIQRRYANHA